MRTILAALIASLTLIPPALAQDPPPSDTESKARALFDRATWLPPGTCIGHGGYPYLRTEYALDDFARASATPAVPRFVERMPRYPAWTGLRQETGNLGYLEMTVGADRVLELVYRDWMKNERCSARLAAS